ncbi:response regulator transcription factor [Actinoplanes derwentensis]|uniref:DNA-binding response regulator, NarL/FixJ family, contains REC and HTH domains n=1 Tax=Actinoplanes derwentensis TaxID=113562 RepID=A0A1H2A863_9ACTN|nr:response regulator transcription factor [Actinoplanes derwentensis]GID88465.1 DNA-binding response regulator [Actinoplanes derwentensis]SDT42165.1 DNA-binding response regulator, NarL/FixJ family, contains REC and HTH domains [Actinoplanes derwentensis]
MTGEPLRVVLADDDSLIRTAIDAILRPVDGIELVAQAADGRAAVELAVRHRPDVALLDIQMPVLDGLAALREIRLVAPAVRVVVLTTFGQDEYVAQALAAGAAGFLLKESAAEELAYAIRAAAAGNAYLSPKITRQVLDRLPAATARPDRDRAKADGLSGREREILILLAQGLSNAEIARQLFVSEGTVKTHVYRIFTKLGCENRVQAAMLAQRAGLLDGDS